MALHCVCGKFDILLFCLHGASCTFEPARVKGARPACCAVQQLSCCMLSDGPLLLLRLLPQRRTDVSISCGVVFCGSHRAVEGHSAQGMPVPHLLTVTGRRCTDSLSNAQTCLWHQR